MPKREADVLRTAIGLVRDRLPSMWESTFRGAPGAKAGRGVDAELRLRSPDGQGLVVLVEAKRLLNTRDVTAVLEPLQDLADRWKGDEEVVVVIAARYLAPATRERIAGAGAGYVDATGNMLVRADRPALFLRESGADRDPWRGPGRPRGSLKGPPAARVVRALLDFAPPYTVPELSKRAGASVGATYRVVEFLDQEELIERDRWGPIREVRWRKLLERWSEDYGALEPRRDVPRAARPRPPHRTPGQDAGPGVRADRLAGGRARRALRAGAAGDRLRPRHPDRRGGPRPAACGRRGVTSRSRPATTTSSSRATSA